MAQWINNLNDVLHIPQSRIPRKFEHAKYFFTIYDGANSLKVNMLQEQNYADARHPVAYNTK
jgi:hypothetical protein